MIKIGLLDVDGKLPNLALMKLSAYHKAAGDSTEIYNPMFSAVDRLYASKVFTNTPDFNYFPACEVVKGGSGYDLKSEIPKEAEHIYPDYDLFGCDYAMGFSTRGCIRSCSFCIVPEKEGKIRAVADISEFWRGQRRIKLLDNNLTAEPEQFRRVLNDLIKHKIKTDFSQGLDIRLIDDDKAAFLAKVSLWKQIHFAFDDVKQEQSVRRGIKILAKAMPVSRLMFYVLVGYNSTEEEDLYRIKLLDSLGVSSFVMPYGKSKYEKDLSRWCNRKWIFKATSWENYKR